MSRMRITIAVLSVVAFAAGLCLGMVWRPHGPPRERRGHTWLTEALDLSAEQQAQIRTIWEGFGRENWRADSDRRREMQRERDAAVRALVPAEQRDELDAITAQYREQMAEQSRNRRAAFEDAVAKTKAILSPAQREKYEAMQSRRGEWRGRGEDRPGRPEDGPAGGRRPPPPGDMPRAANPPDAVDDADPGEAETDVEAEAVQE